MEEIELSNEDIISYSNIFKTLRVGNHIIIILEENNNKILFFDDEFPVYYCGDAKLTTEFLLKALHEVGCLLTKGEIEELKEEVEDNL